MQKVLILVFIQQIFNRVQFEAVRNEAGLNRFVMTPTKWITQMDAIGIVSKAGRYGGIYAHSDITMKRTNVLKSMDKLAFT